MAELNSGERMIVIYRVLHWDANGFNIGFDQGGFGTSVDVNQKFTTRSDSEMVEAKIHGIFTVVGIGFPLLFS